jgi:hypothetical protein
MNFNRCRVLSCIAITLVLALQFSAGRLHAAAAPQFWPEDATESTTWTGRLVRLDEHLAILTVRGGPAERGVAHGKLLKAEIKTLVASVKKYLVGTDGEDHYKKCLDGARTMGKFIDADVMTELKACAAAAGVDADELLLDQLFGDVNRAKGFTSYCSAFAAFGEATVGGKLIVGRNFDYAGHGLEGGVPLILQEIPEGQATHPFVTLCYAGILNGWTSMNSDGLCASNNTLFGGKDTLEGMSTCFLLRKIVERCSTVEDGVALIEKTPRACTTGMLVAGKNAKGDWDARFVEYDSKAVAVIEPKDGTVLATNKRQKFVIDGIQPPAVVECGRYQELKKYLTERHGKLNFDDATQNPVAARLVYMGINLHCAMLDPVGQRIRAAFVIGDNKPAAENIFRNFTVKPTSVSEEK